MTPLCNGAIRQKTVWGSKHESVRQKATWGVKRLLVAAVSLASIFALTTDASAAKGGRRFTKMDKRLEARALRGSSSSRSRVIVTLDHGDLPGNLRDYRKFDRFSRFNSYALDLPDSELQNLANLPETAHIHPDAEIHGMDFRTAVTSGSFFVNHDLALTGAGVTVA